MPATSLPTPSKQKTSVLCSYLTLLPSLPHSPPTCYFPSKQKTNVPDLRLRFRHETHMAELSLLTHGVLTHQARLAAMGQSV